MEIFEMHINIDAIFLLVKFTVGMMILLAASETDRKTKRVPASLWKVGLITIIPLILLDFFMNGRYYMLSWTFALLTTVVASLTIHGITKIGGADFKALIFISLLHPFVGDIMIPYPIILGFTAFTIGLIYAMTLEKGKTFAFVPFITIVHAVIFIIYLF